MNDREKSAEKLVKKKNRNQSASAQSFVGLGIFRIMHRIPSREKAFLRVPFLRFICEDNGDIPLSSTRNLQRLSIVIVRVVLSTTLYK